MGKRTSTELTEKQRETYEYIIHYMEENLISPSFNEICEGIGTKSKSSIHYRLIALMDKGYITFREGEPRTICPIGYKLVKEGKEIECTQNYYQ